MKVGGGGPPLLVLPRIISTFAASSRTFARTGGLAAHGAFFPRTGEDFTCTGGVFTRTGTPYAAPARLRARTGGSDARTARSDARAGGLHTCGRRFSPAPARNTPARAGRTRAGVSLRDACEDLCARAESRKLFMSSVAAILKW